MRSSGARPHLAWQGLLILLASLSGALLALGKDPHRPAPRRRLVVPPPAPPPRVVQSGPCPGDMVQVKGNWCPEVDQHCLAYTEDDRARCRAFRAPSVCRAPRQAQRFCIDRYEWPNRPGLLPMVLVSWHEARAFCRAAGKRLCTRDEWTFACEGEDMLPFPYGFVREPGACTVDHAAQRPDRRLLHSRNPDVVAAETLRVYEAAPSGASPRCVSPFGVYDMTGSVDEWAVNESGTPYRSALKGGWWGRIRGRCRPTTLDHDEGFRYYQIGFRCCSDPAGAR
jgi:formylglycine-generating enzyme required for sulfatase activity